MATAQTPVAGGEAAAQLRVVIGRLSRLLRPTRAGGSLTPTQISVLFTVVRHGPLSFAELAEREALNPTMLSRVVGGLCDAGLVRRTTDPGGALPALEALAEQLR